ncbi:hypothetical protein ACO0SA_003092 [Hanseniaspora valbyensis]
MSSNKSTSQKSSPFKIPLVLYNFISCLLWSVHLYKTIQFVSEGDFNKIQVFYKNTQYFLTITQSLAVIEIFNSLFKIVRSPIVTTAAQVFSRLLIVIGAFQLMPKIGQEIGIEYITLSLAWGLTEVVRYAFYGLNLLNIKSKIIIFLRYNMFPLLYPLGVTSELIVLFKTSNLCDNLLVKIIYIVSMLAYIPGFPVLFSHMWIQRKKAMKELKGEAKEKKN